MVPSVAMNGSILPTVTMTPFARPHSSPVTTAIAIPAGMAQRPRLGAIMFMNMMVMPAMKATIEPTDRSRPPDEMTNVAPTAMMAT